VIPAKYEMRMSAPPQAYYEWRRTTDCETTPPMAAPPAAEPCDPPAGPAGYPVD
jgi:hypothetical protein